MSVPGEIKDPREYHNYNQCRFQGVVSDAVWVVFDVSIQYLYGPPLYTVFDAPRVDSWQIRDGVNTNSRWYSTHSSNLFSKILFTLCTAYPIRWSLFIHIAHYFF